MTTRDTVTVTNEYGLSTTKTFSITHNYVVTKIVEPTCTTKGYSVFKCTSCGDEYEGNVKLAFGHNYDVETIEATCTTYGCIKHTCLNCGDTYETDVRTALGHKYTETTKEATCTEDGGQLHTCTVCGYEYLTDTVLHIVKRYNTALKRAINRSLESWYSTGEYQESQKVKDTLCLERAAPKSRPFFNYCEIFKWY